MSAQVALDAHPTAGISVLFIPRCEIRLRVVKISFEHDEAEEIIVEGWLGGFSGGAVEEEENEDEMRVHCFFLPWFKGKN